MNYFIALFFHYNHKAHCINLVFAKDLMFSSVLDFQIEGNKQWRHLKTIFHYILLLLIWQQKLCLIDQDVL